MTFHKVMAESKSAMGLAMVPVLILGSLGYTDAVLVPVFLSSFATAFVAMLFE